MFSCCSIIGSLDYYKGVEVSNYSFLKLRHKIYPSQLLEALNTINGRYFSYCLVISVSSDDNNDYIIWLHSVAYHLDFQIWLDKETGKRITYHPNVQPVITSVIEEFIVIKLKKVFGGRVYHEC